MGFGLKRANQVFQMYRFFARRARFGAQVQIAEVLGPEDPKP